MRKGNIGVPILILLIAFTAGCAKRQLTKSEIDQVSSIEAKLAKAEEMGGKECAPKEFARTMATLDHAKHELDERDEDAQGYLNDAERLADDLLAKTQVCWDKKQQELLPTVSFSADPDSIEKGKCSTLSWTSTKATDVSIDQEVGSVSASGNKEVCPTSKTTYTITATAPGGSVSDSATVNVTMAVEVPKFENIYFDFDKSFIRDDAKPELEKVAAYMKKDGDVRVLIEGHCDERGTNEYNIALGDRRAQAAKNYLIDLGVDGKRIKTISYGEERPADPGHNEDAWAKNRRDVFAVQK